MSRFHQIGVSYAIVCRHAVLALLLFTALGAARAQSGHFVIPSFRGHNGEFANWDLFDRPPGSSVNVNYANPPALLDGMGMDDNGNATTLFAPRATLVQTGTSTCFVTSSGALYSFSDITTFEARYTAPGGSTAPVNNVIFQVQTGGTRLDENGMVLVYTDGTGSHSVSPEYKALDDPQAGTFGQRLVSAFQWDLTGLNVRDFKIVFSSPEPSMPLWQAQLDTVAGMPFVRQLGYLLSTRSLPVTRFGRVGSVDKNLAVRVDSRYFIPGQALNLLGSPEDDWEHVGWVYDGQVSSTPALALTFPAHDITVSALFAPLAYDAWREVMFDHANSLTGALNDYSNDAVSAATVDHDNDGASNAAEYAFGGDPYTSDESRWRPRLLLVNQGGVDYPAIRYRTNGAAAGDGDVSYTVRLSPNGVTWAANATVTAASELQDDGTVLVTERATQPLSSFTFVAMDVAWTLDGTAQTPMAPAALSITTPSLLAGGLNHTLYSAQLAASGGMAPYAWSLTDGALPPGLILGQDGLVAGTPSADGTFTFTVRVVDVIGAAVTRSFSITIAPFSITTAPSLPGGLQGAAYSTQLAGTGGTVPYTWSLSDGTLPAGLDLSTGGLLSGTPTAAGSSHFTVEISDSNHFTATKSFDLTVIQITITTASPLVSAVKGVAYPQTFTGTGGATPYTWSVDSGALPAGLSLNPTTGALSGAPTVAGDFSFVLKLTDASNFAVTKAFSLPVSPTYVKPVMNPVSLGSTVVGVSYTYALSAQNYPKTFTVTGLPAGLACNATTGIISGRPAVSGVFNVKLSARNTAGTSAILTVPLTVKALPNTLLGSFAGLVARDGTVNNNLGSLLSLTTTATGSFTAKVTTGAVAKSATGFLAATAPQVVITLDGKPLSLTLANNLVSGIFGSASVNGWRSTWNAQLNPATHRIGYYSFALELDSQDTTLPQGYGYGNFNVAAAGTLVIAGKTADGSAIATSTFLGPNGEIAVYGGLGAVTGKLILAEDPNQEFAGNILTGALSWKKAATTGRTYAAAFGPVNLNAAGGYLAPNTVGEVLGLPDAGTADVKFTEGGIDASATEADVTGFTYTDNNAVIMPVGPNNQAKATLGIAKGTGAVSGKFTLVETTPALTRANIAFQGQTVRLSTGTVKAVGYFQLPQIPVAPQTAATAPILSGAFTIEQ